MYCSNIGLALQFSLLSSNLWETAVREGGGTATPLPRPAHHSECQSDDGKRRLDTEDKTRQLTP